MPRAHRSRTGTYAVPWPQGCRCEPAASLVGLGENSELWGAEHFCIGRACRDEITHRWLFATEIGSPESKE